VIEAFRQRVTPAEDSQRRATVGDSTFFPYARNGERKAAESGERIADIKTFTERPRVRDARAVAGDGEPRCG
jgi:hypothetical protein